MFDLSHIVCVAAWMDRWVAEYMGEWIEDGVCFIVAYN